MNLQCIGREEKVLWGLPGILWFSPKFRHQAQLEFPAALEEIGFSEIRLVLLQFQIQTLMF